MFLDRLGEAKVRRSYSELSDGGTTVPCKVQAAHGTSIQDWYGCKLFCLVGWHLQVPFWSVKPDATPEEIKAAVNDDSGGQIFSQAVGLALL